MAMRVMKRTTRIAALLAFIGVATAQDEYYSTWTYTSNDCADDGVGELIRTENYRLYTCVDDGSGVTSMYSCLDTTGVVRVDYMGPGCNGTENVTTVLPAASLGACMPDGKGYFLKHFCGERDSYSVNGDLVVYERLNQPATPGDEDCPSFPTYIRGTVTRTCIHDSETDQSYVYYCDDDGMSRAVFDGPNCQGVGTVTGKHLGSDECVDADQMPFLNATTGHASFTCVSNVYDLSDDDGFDWVTEQTALIATASTFAVIAGIMLTYLGYRWGVQNCWTFEERISDPTLKPAPGSSG